MADTPYPNLAFAPGVDWRDVNPNLLAAINRTAGQKHQVVDIVSGYRAPGSAAGFAGDPHQQGQAVDAYLNGVGLAKAWGPSVFKALGLRSGNVPNFYKGQPDPEHVDTLVNGTNAAPGPGYQDTGNWTPPGPVPMSTTPGQGDDAASSPAPAPTPTQPTPDMKLATVTTAPGGNRINANVLQPAPALQESEYETWQYLASLPGASTDTLKMAQMAGYNAPATQG